MTTPRIAEEVPKAGRVGGWTLAIAISAAALGAGTTHTITLCVVAAALACATALVWWNGDASRPRPSATVLVVTVCALTAYTAIQSVPLPIRWLACIAPHNAEIWSRALAPLHETGPGWAPISLDPIATRAEVLKGTAYLLAFVSALSLARRRRGVAFLSRTIVVTGLLLGIAALIHPAFGAHKLYGIWEPREQDVVHLRHLAPLFNPNNLAGYLNVALCLALAAALSREPYCARPILVALTALLAGIQIWIASRGGVAAMVLGAILVVAISRAGRFRGQRRELSVVILVGALAAAGAFMTVVGGSERAMAELLDTDTSKFQLFLQAMRMVPAYPMWGAGRGSFESAFPAFRRTEGTYVMHVTYTHPENVVAQWIVEWGVPIGVSGLVMIAFALRPSAVLARSSAAGGAWAGIVAVSVQNLADLGSEVPGLVLATVVCAAIVVGGTAGRKARWTVERWTERPRALAIGAVTLATCAIVAASAGIGHELGDDQRTLHDAAIERRIPAAKLDALARSAMLHHPAEPYLPFVVALVQNDSARGESPLPWIEATLERARIYGPAHFILARWLASRSRAQARLEYRLASEQAPELLSTVMAEAPRLVSDYDDAIELVSSGRPAAAQLDALSVALQTRLPATAARLDEELLRRVPSDPRPLLRQAIAAIGDLESSENLPWCQGIWRGDCVAVALARARLLQRLAPSACQSHVLLARATIASGNVPQGLKELSEATEVVSDRLACLKALFQLAQEAGAEHEATAALEKIVSAGCDDSGCATSLAWAAEAEERRGNPQRALGLFTRALEREPDGPEADAWLRTIATLAASAGLHGDSAAAYERLARRHPGDADLPKAAALQRAAALKAALQR